ncbi:MAG: hypothetical protein KDG50_08610 [Chromatiales bacterium]|nr:hypothetical protein [Chromatiales bacterium]
MKNPIRRLLLLTLLLTLCRSASANIMWDWSANGGQDHGRFVTTGDVTGGTVAAGDYVILEFFMDKTSVVALQSLEGGSWPGGPFNLFSGPDLGMLWDGSAVTQYYRDSGVSTNGFGFATSPTGGYTFPYWVFDVGLLIIADDSGPGATFNFTDQTTTPDLVPTPPSLLLVLAGMFALRRRFRAA